jgi:plasmid segregation protein ParM
MNDKGEMTPLLKKYWSSNVMIFDGGFGTLDIYLLRGNEVERSTTDDNLGMKRVFDEVRKALYKDHNISVTIPEIMSCLGTGKIRRVNKKTLSAEEIDFSSYIKTANRIVAQEALDSIRMDLGSVDNLVLTGGTGAAWFHIFEDKLKNLTSAGVLNLIPGNAMNLSLPYYLSNVRGYYLKRYYQEAHRKA